MKKFHPIIIAFLIGALSISCNSDDNALEQTIRNITGVVNGPVSCNTDGKGPAIGIDPENFELSSGFIISATLPGEFKQEGLRIRFDMKPSTKYITICTANFASQQFYEVINVTALGEGN